MGVAGEDVNVLVRGVLRVPEGLVSGAAGSLALGPIVHAVIAADAAGEGGVHTDDDRADSLIGFVPLNDGAEPLKLGVIELIAGGVVEGDEINVAIDPVIVGAEDAIGGIVGEALLAEGGGVDPVGELQEVGV